MTSSAAQLKHPSVLSVALAEFLRFGVSCMSPGFGMVGSGQNVPCCRRDKRFTFICVNTTVVWHFWHWWHYSGNWSAGGFPMHLRRSILTSGESEYSFWKRHPHADKANQNGGFCWRHDLFQIVATYWDTNWATLQSVDSLMTCAMDCRLLTFVSWYLSSNKPKH